MAQRSKSKDKGVWTFILVMVIIIATFFFGLNFGIFPFDWNVGLPFGLLQLGGYAALCTFLIIFIATRFSDK